MVLKIEMTDLSEQQTTPSKYAGLGVIVGFWFDVGAMLAVGVADCLNQFVRAVTIGK